VSSCFICTGGELGGEKMASTERVTFSSLKLSYGERNAELKSREI
jgi:hypothetical protein